MGNIKYSETRILDGLKKGNKSMKLVEIKREVTDLVPIGLYAVHFEAIYGNKCLEGEHDDCLEHGCFDYGQEYIEEIEPSIDLVTSENYRNLPFDVTGKDDTFNANGLWQGDTHDFRPRLFVMKKEAEQHIKETMARFKNPQPWEAFVTFK